MKYPLTALCIAFCLGILVAAYLKVSCLLFYILAFFFLIPSIIFIKQNVKFNIFILCTIFFLGATIFANSKNIPRHHIANITPCKGSHVTLIGVIDNDPIYKERIISFILRTEKIKIDDKWHSICGKVLVKFFDKGEFVYGDRLLLEGNLSRPFSFSKNFDYIDYLKHRGIFSILNVKKGSNFKKQGSLGSPLKSFAFQLKHKARNVIVRNLPPFSANVLNAIMLGERQNLPSYVRDALAKSGSIHIIAISGLHLGMIAFIILAVLKVMRMPTNLQYIFTMILLVIYCIMTGARIPVIRATIMALILLISYLLKREPNIYNSLSLAALIILLINPWQIFEISFQLSFLSIISIAYFTPKVKALFSMRLYQVKWMRFLILGFSVSLSAWLGLLPLIAYYFKIIAPVTVLANVILVPYTSIVLASGFTLILTGILAPPLVHIFAVSCHFFILSLFKINALLISIPGAYFKLPYLWPGYVFIYYVLLISIFNFSKIKKVI